MARILVFTPTYDNLLQTKTVKSIKAMQFDGQLEWVVSDENPYPGRDMRNVTHQYVTGRKAALIGGFDGLLLVEHDMIVPPDALQKLWDTDADVVYGCYELRHGTRQINLFQYIGRQNIGMSLTHYPEELSTAREQGWCEVSGVGFGCLLIKRDALIRVPFRETDNAPDLPFATDCIAAGIRQIGRTDVVCGHIDINERIVLWPFDGSGEMKARVLALQNVTVADVSGSVAMVAGGEYMLDINAARQHARAGYVRLVNEVETAISTQAEQRETATTRPTRKRKQ